MDKNERTRLENMINIEPIENPCPEMIDLGYTYEYRKGLIDKTPYYTRVEEDCIIYTGDKYILRFNLASRALVISMRDDNALYYGGEPTFFINEKLNSCINKITHNLGWDS